MACRLTGANPLSEPMMKHCWLGHYEKITQRYFNRNLHIFIHKNALENIKKLYAIFSRPKYTKDGKWAFVATFQCILLAEQQVRALWWVVDIIFKPPNHCRRIKTVIFSYKYVIQVIQDVSIATIFNWLVKLFNVHFPIFDNSKVEIDYINFFRPICQRTRCVYVCVTYNHHWASIAWWQHI